MSGCTTTVPYSVRNSDPVGHTSRQAAWVQCLHTSEDISQRKSIRASSLSAAAAACGSVDFPAIASTSIPAASPAGSAGSGEPPPQPPPSPQPQPPEFAPVASSTGAGGPDPGMPRSTGGRFCSTKATCRQLLDPSAPVLS